MSRGEGKSEIPLGANELARQGCLEEPDLGVRPAVAPRAGHRLIADLPPELASRLVEKGWILLQEIDQEQASFTGGYLLAYVIFDRPRPEVFRLLQQTERQPEYRPELRSVIRVKELPDGRVDEHRIKIMLMNIVYRLRFRIDRPASRIYWELDPTFDNDLERAEGFWELDDFDKGRTLARFGNVVDVGPALPSSLQDMITRRKLPATIEAVREWVGSQKL
jgi:hypothetical protein